MDHLGIEQTPARRAILTGDPGRIPAVAARLGGGRELTGRRGMLCWEVPCGGEPVLVVATGIGGPSMAIVVEELAELGLHTLVRLGTCGAIQEHILPGDLIVATACVRDEGTSRQYVEPGFPAVADLELAAELIRELGRRGATFHHGLVHCKDAYYLERPGKQLLPESVAGRWRALRRAGVLATEMESSTLFVLGSLRRLRTATVLVSVGSAESPGPLALSLDVAVDAIRGAIGTVRPLDPLPGMAAGRHDAESYLDSERWRS